MVVQVVVASATDPEPGQPVGERGHEEAREKVDALVDGVGAGGLHVGPPVGLDEREE